MTVNVGQLIIPGEARSLGTQREGAGLAARQSDARTPREREPRPLGSPSPSWSRRVPWRWICAPAPFGGRLPLHSFPDGSSVRPATLTIARRWPGGTYGLRFVPGPLRPHRDTLRRASLRCYLPVHRKKVAPSAIRRLFHGAVKDGDDHDGDAFSGRFQVAIIIVLAV